MIPSWNMEGIIPPIRPGEAGSGADRSPYIVPLSEVVDEFAATSERIQILQGLLDYRVALHTLGIISGFQWLDGSFMEDVENHEGRSPNDIDVVTYFHLPTGETQATLLAKAGNTFSAPHIKSTFLVDAYLQVIGEPTQDYHVRQISYWYSMWSHRRNGTWKGFIQVDLNPNEDSSAKLLLGNKKAGGSTI